MTRPSAQQIRSGLQHSQYLCFKPFFLSPKPQINEDTPVIVARYLINGVFQVPFLEAIVGVDGSARQGPFDYKIVIEGGIGIQEGSLGAFSDEVSVWLLFSRVARSLPSLRSCWLLLRHTLHWFDKLDPLKIDLHLELEVSVEECRRSG